MFPLRILLSTVLASHVSSIPFSILLAIAVTLHIMLLHQLLFRIARIIANTI